MKVSIPPIAEGCRHRTATSSLAPSQPVPKAIAGRPRMRLRSRAAGHDLIGLQSADEHRLSWDARRLDTTKGERITDVPVKMPKIDQEIAAAPRSISFLWHRYDLRSAECPNW
jgi:hypothetical protein